MQIGVVFPQLEIGVDPQGLRTYARGVRDLGYRHIVAFDHVLGADPVGHPGWSGAYDIDDCFHEPFALFSYLAAVVPEIEMVPGVIVLPQRQTVLVAKQAAQVDVLTGGRFRLGVGLGWNAVEFEGLGMDFRNRARRMEEQIELLRILWTQRTVTFHGRYHSIQAAGLNPLPVQRPIPIWFGATAEPALRRAARLGDGLFTLRPLPQGWSYTLDRLREWRREAGRDPESFGIEARLPAHPVEPEHWRAKVEEWRQLGASHLSVTTMGGGLSGPDEHLRRLDQVMQAIA
ncbi:MAG: LLM class F420-dependent oxidoreductase [Armatimonadetes bacterium]|nr:LLM class F420-dependent oxidoreductase [Armatimonadota bacterium]